MKLKQAKRLTLVEQVVSQIEALIQSGTWPVGTRIPAEPELVNDLGVSRNTVREAVRALIHAGLLEARQGDGTYVCSSSDLGAALFRRLQRATIAETLEVRYALEREAVRLAALRRTSEDVVILRELLARIESESSESYIQADVELHLAIAASTQNTVLMDLYEYMSEALRKSIMGILDDSALTQTSHTAHRAIVEAIAAQDPIAAEQATLTYIEAARTAFQNKDA